MMDLRLVICVAVVAMVTVEAGSAIGCGILCKYGLIPGTCRCRPSPVHTTNTCAVRFCPINTRCVPTFPVAKCVPVDVCRQPKDPGPCAAAIPLYYFNSASRRCEKFSHGGCQGNGNNFKTLQDCNARCGRPHGYY